MGRSRPGIPAVTTCSFFRLLPSGWETRASQNVGVERTGVGELIVFHGLPWAEAPEAACIPALREPCSRWLESRPLEP